MAQPTPIFSAIVATYERYRLLEDAIASLLRQDLDPNKFEIIVIDNSLDQDAAGRFGTQFESIPNVRYVLEPTLGNTTAWNRGAGLARGSIVGLMDDDAVASSDWIRQILSAFAAYDGRAGCVGGRIVPRWTAPQPSWLPDDLLGYLSIVDWGGSMRELGPDEWLAGCNLAFDRESLLTAGGFNASLGRKGSEAILLSNAETGTYERIRRLGKAVVYAPAAVVEHVIDPSRLTQEWMRRRVAWQVVSDYLKDQALMAAKVPAATRRAQRQLGTVSTAEDAAAFRREHDAIKDLVLGLLSGTIGVNSAQYGPGRVARIGRIFRRQRH